MRPDVLLAPQAIAGRCGGPLLAGSARSCLAAAGSARSFAAAAFLGSCSMVVGCGQPPPKSQFPTADDALGRMHDSYACTVGVRGTAKVDLIAKKGRIKAEVDLTAVNPESVRFDVTTPVVFSQLYTLTSDGKDFKFADQEQKQFLFGPAKECNLARFTQVPVPPHALVSLLRGEAPVLVHTKEQARISWNEDGYYQLLLQSKHAASQEIRLQIPDEDFDKPWKDQRVRVTYVRVAQQARDIYQADLSNHKSTNTSEPLVDEDGLEEPVLPSGPACAAELPRTIRFRVPNTKDDVEFDYSDTARWNPPLIPGTFDQPVPGGMPKQFVDCK